jgi:hypothetical protein
MAGHDLLAGKPAALTDGIGMSTTEATDSRWLFTT